MRLEAGVENARRPYLLLGSFSGTTPGFALPTLSVPLLFDAYTRFGIHSPNTSPLRSSSGLLDEDGRAYASFFLSKSSDPALIGLTVHHAFLVFDNVVDMHHVVLVSNAIPVELVD